MGTLNALYGALIFDFSNTMLAIKVKEPLIKEDDSCKNIRYV
jgi:hypothetical protein